MSVIICIVCSFVACVICLGARCWAPDSACFLLASCLPIYLVRCVSLPGCLLSSLPNGFIESRAVHVLAVCPLSLTIKGSQTSPDMDIYIYRSLTCIGDRGLKAHHQTRTGEDRLQASLYWPGENVCTSVLRSHKMVIYVKLWILGLLGLMHSFT